MIGIYKITNLINNKIKTPAKTKTVFPEQTKTVNLNIRIEKDLAQAFDQKVKSHNNQPMTSKINKSLLLREFIIKFIKKK